MAEPDYDDLKLCDCAQCGRELASTTAANAEVVRRLKARHGGLPLPEFVAGRIAGRPYCSACLATPRRKVPVSLAPRRQSRGEADGDNPWLDKATRDREEARDEGC